MKRGADTAGPQPGESPKERVDRELHELLEEIRVALPGLQLLLGFLLILPFNDRFAAIDGLERAAYLTSFMATAVAAALLMAPSATHRMGFRRLDKERLLWLANRQLLIGLALVALAIALAVYLVISVVVGSPWAALLSALVAGWYALWWFALPAVQRRT